MPKNQVSPSGLLFYGALLVAAAAVFGYWPELDLWASRSAWEFNGGGFQKQDGWWWWLYDAVRPAMIGAGALGTLCGLASFLLKRPVLGFTLWSGLYVLLAIAVIQGLVVDLYLKDWWGRARPRTIEEFGGQLRFTPFFLVTDQCEKNCSFVSGHAAGGFAFFAFSFLIKGPWRSALFWFALAFGSLAGYMRVLQGAHFLSDVVFSGLVVYGVTWLLFWSMERTVGPLTPT